MKRWKIFLLLLLIVAIIAAVCAMAILRRGFRATTEPSSFEKTLATAVRNLAIPRRARDEKNPWAATSENLKEAREHFIARCAICHGSDGRGKTQMGASLYPRVPDLLSSETQNLTD